MKPSGIGGQAVMEGVMMKNKETYSVAVRKPDKEIVVDVQTYGADGKIKALRQIPFIRGVFNFVDSLYLGTKVLTYSASFFEEEEEKKDKAEKKQKKDNWFQRNREDIYMGLTVCFSLILSIAIFFCVPFYISELFRRFVTQESWIVAMMEGVLRIGIFILYVVLISLMEDIQRVFMYHGAEHKSINCIENGMELNVENVKKCSRLHKRCGTSFLLIVMIISVVFLFFIRAESRWVRLGIRLALIPVIAGVSYEFIRLAGRTENRFVTCLSKPGMWLQKLTTREPDDSMIEVAIAAVEAVFDWKAFLQDAELEQIKIKKEKGISKAVSGAAENG